MKEISIEKVVIKIGNETLELTMEETKELKAKLNELVGNMDYYVIPYQPSRPYEPYTDPNYYYPTVDTKPLCGWSAYGSEKYGI